MAGHHRTPEAIARRKAREKLRYQTDAGYRARKNAAARLKYNTDAEYRAKHNKAAKDRPLRVCAECGETKMHQGHGLCATCYGRRKRRNNLARSLAYEQRWRDKNRERERVRLRAYYARTKVKQMVRAAKWRAEQSGVPFNITERDVSIPMFCPVLGIPIEQASGRQSPNSPSLDKIKPRLGYVRGNVQVVSARANTLKRDGTLDEFKAIIRYLEVSHENSRRGARTPVLQRGAAQESQAT